MSVKPNSSKKCQQQKLFERIENLHRASKHVSEAITKVKTEQELLRKTAEDVQRRHNKAA